MGGTSGFSFRFPVLKMSGMEPDILSNDTHRISYEGSNMFPFVAQENLNIILHEEEELRL